MLVLRPTDNVDMSRVRLTVHVKKECLSRHKRGLTVAAAPDPTILLDVTIADRPDLLGL